MSLSIITPHHNDLEGLQQLYHYLQNQTLPDWEWVVVDDLSDVNVRQEMQLWFNTLNAKNIHFIFNVIKTNASVCRNLGAENSIYPLLLFLDADDMIAVNFVLNRNQMVKDFMVFPNHQVLETSGTLVLKQFKNVNFLNYFLSANFIWQTSCILWNKSFFTKLGGFNPKLPRLQDVELAVRALQQSKDFKVLDNTIDFYYRVKPIRQRKNFVAPVCESVRIFIFELLDTSKLNTKQLALLSGYYFQCVRYFERSESLEDINLVQSNLKLFHKYGYIGSFAYILGAIMLKLFAWKLVSSHFFLKVNRYVFKPKDHKIA